MRIMAISVSWLSALIFGPFWHIPMGVWQRVVDLDSKWAVRVGMVPAAATLLGIALALKLSPVEPYGMALLTPAAALVQLAALPLHVLAIGPMTPSGAAFTWCALSVLSTTQFGPAYCWLAKRRRRREQSVAL